MLTRCLTRIAAGTALLCAMAVHAQESAPKILPAPAPTKATLGQKAPAFTLTDIDGKTHSLSDYAGQIVVLEWFNAGCPYSGRKSDFAVTSGRTQALRKNIASAAPGTVYLLIDSSADRDKTAIVKDNLSARKTLKIDAPILIDDGGSVGRAYSARTTPHMFVIDEQGVLRYQGAFDDDRKNNKGDKATNHVLEAVKKVKAGGSPAPAKTRPWGCSVKYG